MPTVHKSQLIGKEKQIKVTLPSGRVVTLLDDGECEIFARPGRPANFSGVADRLIPECHYMFTRLKTGEQVQVFVDTLTGLVSVDAVKGQHGRSVAGHLRRGRRFVLESLEAAL